MNGTLYKITNIINNMCYYGIVFGKNKTINDRFREHMTGKGGIFLYTEGVLKFGEKNFIIEEIETNDLNSIRDLESKLNKNNLWPIGYNGNYSHAIVVTDEQHKKITKSKKEKWNLNPELKPIPPNWKGKQRSDTMKSRLSASKLGHKVSAETREKLRIANLGKKCSKETNSKRKNSLEKNPKSYNRNHWLAIDRHGIGHYNFGNRYKLFKQIGCAASKNFYNSLNTGIPVTCNRNSPNNGWTFYNDSLKINELIKNGLQIINYE
jgi:hypothetical protein